MASKIDLYNMALGHCGNSTTIAGEQERTPERVICDRFFELATDTLLAWRSADWRFAQTQVVLSDIGSPPTNWLYRYRYPNDCLRAMYLVVPGLRNAPNEGRPPFEVVYEDDGRAIVSDLPSAELVYIRRITTIERLPSTIVSALSLWLASLICMPLMKDPQLRERLEEQANRASLEALAQALNEAQPDLEPDASYIREMHG